MPAILQLKNIQKGFGPRVIFDFPANSERGFASQKWRIPLGLQLCGRVLRSARRVGAGSSSLSSWSRWVHRKPNGRPAKLDALGSILPRGFAGEWLLLDDVRRLGTFRALRGLELDRLTFRQ